MKSDHEQLFSLLTQFIKFYEGPKLNILLTGAGITLANICAIPGASKVVRNISIPYENDSLISEVKAVSEEAVELYYKHLNPIEHNPTVICTGALTTSRYRRGNNHAFIGIYLNEKPIIEHYQLLKLSEEDFLKLSEDEINDLRFYEDLNITKKILSCVQETLKN